MLTFELRQAVERKPTADLVAVLLLAHAAAAAAADTVELAVEEPAADTVELAIAKPDLALVVELA